MASQPNTDPVDMWRQALSILESNINALSNRGMNCDEFTQALQNSSQFALGLQQAVDKALRQHFKLLNLPSRDDIDSLAAALQRVEDKLDQLAPPPVPSGPRPARTRRPPDGAAVAPPDGEVKRTRAAGASRRKAGSA